MNIDELKQHITNDTARNIVSASNYYDFMLKIEMVKELRGIYDILSKIREDQKYKSVGNHENEDLAD